MENNSSETVLFSLPLARLEPIFKGWIKDVLKDLPPAIYNPDPSPGPAPDPGADSYMTTKQLQAYLPEHPHLTTIYSWIRNGEIPVYKNSFRLRFRKSEIDAWLNSGRKKTYAELYAETSNKRIKR